ncbi:MAG: hypothetical protein ACR2NP_04040, partial [Pirellulaceae bacterium]
MRNHFCNSKRWTPLLVAAVFISSWIGCQVPQIDPIGRGVFVPGSTPVLTPFGTPQVQTLPPVQPAVIQAPQVVVPPTNSGPAFQQPPVPPPCPQGGCGAQLGQPALQPTGSLVSHGHHGGHHHNPRKHTHRSGTLITTPDRIIAPVGSEVVVMAGICGEDGHYITNQPLEWMLSQDSAGQIVEVGGMDHSLFNQLVPPTSRKFAGDYAWGRTGLKSRFITRGTDTTVDDLEVKKGQTWLSLTS